VEFKNKAYDSNCRETIQIPFLREIQISVTLLMEIEFSLQEGVTKSLLAKFRQNPKFQDFPGNCLMNCSS
jgi:hypothetical protein